MKINLITVIFTFVFSISAQSATLTPIPGSHFKVNIVAARNYNSADLEKLQRAVSAVEAVMNSQEFKQNMLNFSYNGQNNFVQNETANLKNMSNEQIYNYLMTAAEMYPVQRPSDETMDVELQLYKPKWYQSKKVIGYTDITYSTIFVNQFYYRKELVSDVADNMVHEWCHKMGFDHDFKNTPRRPYSVPYGVGYMVDDMIVALGLN